MLCDVCNAIFAGGTRGRKFRLKSVEHEHGRTDRYTHHSTTQSLIDSEKLGCYICVPVWKDASLHGFPRGHVKWQSDCSTSYILRTLDQQTFSQTSLELLISYARRQKGIGNGPGFNEIFFTKFILEPNASVTSIQRAQTSQNVFESTGSDAALNLARKWLHTCLEDHPDCFQTGSRRTQLPNRLIRVGNEGDIVYLCEDTEFLTGTKNSFLPMAESYFTLSHCWGRAKILKLEESTHKRLKSGIKISELPQTFQDAIIITRKLGVKYLWIDSLCIFQDSKEDWLRESSTMTRIYGQALCNIAATSSFDSTGGCFRDRNLRSIQPCWIDAEWDGLPKGLYNIYHERLWEREVAGEPLYRRAWVVQERLLAPRVLNFGKRQLFWECNSTTACETHPEGIPTNLSLSDPVSSFKGLNPSVDGENLRKLSEWDCSDPALNQLYIWEKVVSTYTACFLTRPEDKLVAVSGIAKQVQPLVTSIPSGARPMLPSFLPARYLAGLWNFELPSQLLWEVRQGKRAKTYRAPSWSWASLDGRVGFHTAFNDGHNLIEITKSETTPASEDTFGQTNDGFIQISGNLICVSMIGTRKYEDSESYSMTINERGLGTLCHPDFIYEAQPSRLYCMPVRLYRMTIGNIRSQRLGCLILQPTGSSPGHFKRWAQVTLDNEADRNVLELPATDQVLDFEAYDIGSGKYTFTII